MSSHFQLLRYLIRCRLVLISLQAVSNGALWVPTALAGWSILKIGPLGGKLAIIPLDTREGFKNRRRLCVLIFCYGYCLKESYPESRVWYF